MSRIVSRFPLPPMSLGTERHLTVHAYGDPDARPKAYLQAGLHADELPGSLVLHHLMSCKLENSWSPPSLADRAGAKDQHANPS